jgi:hypothetical protein
MSQDGKTKEPTPSATTATTSKNIVVTIVDATSLLT